MLSKEEIEKLLQSVAPELYIAHAVRSALRALPLLAAEKPDEPPFWYWPEQDRSKHFLAVLNGLQISRVISVAGLDSLHVTAAVKVASASDDVYAACTAIDSDVATDFDVTDTCVAAATAVKFARAAYDNVLLKDINVIARTLLFHIFNELQQEQVTSAVELLQRPLWPAGKMPVSIQAKWQLLYRWAKSFGSGFEYWLDWYQDCLDGKAVDIDLLKKQFDILAEIRSPENKG